MTSTPTEQIPVMEVIWSVLTMVLASAKNFKTLIAVRFFVGALLRVPSLTYYTAYT